MSKCFLRVLFFAVFAILSFSQLIAQDDSSTPDSYKRPLLTLKFALLPLVDYTPAAQIAVEIRTKNQQAAQLEIGYVFGPLNPNNQSDFQGFKLKGEYRFYNQKPEKLARNLFYGLQYMHKQVHVAGSAAFWRNNGSFQEILPFKLINYTNSVYATLGQIVPLVGNVQLELAGGLGARRLDITYIDLPADARLSQGNDFRRFDFNNNNREGTYFYPALFISMKIVVPIVR